MNTTNHAPTALITGAAKRLGREIALELARAGYGLILHYRRSADEALDTATQCLELGASFATLIQADLNDPAQRAKLIPDAFEKSKSTITLLINNASIFEYDCASSFTSESFLQHLQTNYVAPVEMTMAMHQAYRDRSITAIGHVVTLLDQKVFNLNSDYLSYTLAKLACQSSIRFLAQSCAPVLRVNAVAPGVTLLSGDMTEDDLRRARGIAALGQSSSAKDIAEIVRILDASKSVTGQTITVDGGQHLIPRARDVAFE